MKRLPAHETMTRYPVRNEITRGAISIFAGVALWDLLARAT
jgi:hypothetical protein